MKVLCIKDYYEINDKIIFIKDHYYEVFIEYDDSLWIHPNDDVPYYNVTKFYKKDHNKIRYNQDDIFENYFCKISEARKEKINKLNNLK